MDRHETPDEARAHLWKIVRATRFAMLTSRDADGCLRARPLTTQNDRDDTGTTLTFFVGADSALVQEVAADPVVGVAYANTDDDSYVSICGRARVTHDPQRATQLWNTFAKSWFPGGPDDPNLRVLEVAMESAEYWDTRASKAVQLLKMAAAAATGKRPVDIGEHADVPVGRRG